MKKNLKNDQDLLDKFVGKVELNKEALSNVNGGVGSGYWATVSGDCNGTGRSCMHAFDDMMDGIKETIRDWFR